jgi:hypothetical protein
MPNDREAPVEDYLRQRTEALGGFCLKLNPLWYLGIPDRLVLLPGARIGFAELKRPSGGRREAKQLWWRKTLTAMGFTCRFVKTYLEVDEFLQFI